MHMKTPYEVRAKYGFNRIIFGKSKKKYQKLYWVMLAFMLALGLLLS